MSYLLLTALAVLAFAANSILCRMALSDHSIDAASFTAVRLISGAVALALLLLYRHRTLKKEKINVVSALMLFTYAICFSFSYTQLSTGTGALILFGSVQLSLMLSGLIQGERPGTLTWAGIVIAFSGLVYLLLPGVTAPPFVSALLMVTAGIAWSIYTLRGRASKNPLLTTAWNFIGTLPLVAITALVFHSQISLSNQGIALAMLSGALASGMGYAIWYSALPSLTATNAATVQLSVPVIAALGGVMVLAEPITSRLIIASLVVLGGVYLTIQAKSSNA